MGRGDEALEAFTPFQQDQCLAIQNLLEPESQYFRFGIEPVKVDMVDGDRLAIFVDQCESRAGNLIF